MAFVEYPDDNRCCRGGLCSCGLGKRRADQGFLLPRLPAAGIFAISLLGARAAKAYDDLHGPKIDVYAPDRHPEIPSTTTILNFRVPRSSPGHAHSAANAAGDVEVSVLREGIPTGPEPAEEAFCMKRQNVASCIGALEA